MPPPGYRLRLSVDTAWIGPMEYESVYPNGSHGDHQSHPPA